MPFDDDADEGPSPFRPPPHPDDRLWRHPSELGARAFAPQPGPLAGSSPRHSGRPWGAVVVAGTAGVVLAGAGALAFGVGHSVVDRPAVEPVALDTTASSPSQADPPSSGVIDGVRRRVAPAVVAVDASTNEADGENRGQAGSRRTMGAGIVVRDDGIVLTSAALVAGAAPLAVRLPDGSSVNAKVVGVDPATGIAVLDLDGRGYTTGVLAAESDLEVGTTTFTVGVAATGETTGSAGTVGPTSRYVTSSGTVLDSVVEVTAAAPALALGGPLVDGRGSVVGIVTAVDDGTAAYVAPVEVARKVSDDVLATGHVRHCWLGIMGSDVSPPAAETVPTARQSGGSDAGREAPDGGVEIASVVPGSPADHVGLRPGDVLVDFDGRTIGHMPDLMLALRSHSPGDRVELAVVRKGERTTRTLTLATLPPSSP